MKSSKTVCVCVFVCACVGWLWKVCPAHTLLHNKHISASVGRLGMSPADEKNGQHLFAFYLYACGGAVVDHCASVCVCGALFALKWSGPSASSCDRCVGVVHRLKPIIIKPIGCSGIWGKCATLSISSYNSLKRVFQKPI